MPDYYRPDCQISIGARELVFRNLDAALTIVKHKDLLQDGGWPIAEPYLKSEKHYPLGGGEIASKISYLGYDPSEEALPLWVQSAVGIYLALGKCVTTGTALGTPFTDVVASVSTNVITMTTNTSMTPDAHIGNQVEVTSGVLIGNKYAIIDNDGTTLTLEDAPAATIDGLNIKVETAPFTHVITEQRARPSFPIHVEQENETDAQSIRIDLLGVIMKNLLVNFDLDADATQDMGVSVAKGVAGSDLSSPTANPVELYNWCHFQTPGSFSFTYNSLDLLTVDVIDQISFEIINDSELRKTIGNCWSNKHIPGYREHSIKMHYLVNEKVLYGLRNTKHTDYLTDIALTAKFARSTTDYIQFVYDKLRLIDYPNTVPSKDDKIVGVDVEFVEAPGNALIVTAMDDLNVSYYERI